MLWTCIPYFLILFLQHWQVILKLQLHVGIWFGEPAISLSLETFYHTVLSDGTNDENHDDDEEYNIEAKGKYES